MDRGVSPYLTPEELKKLFVESGKTTKQVNELVSHPTCSWGPVKMYPVAPEDEAAFKWTGGLIKGHQSWEPLFIELIQALCRDNGIPTEVSDMIFVCVMREPLSTPKPPKVLPGWMKEDFENTEIRYEGQPWWVPEDMPWEEVLEQARVQRQKDRDMLKEVENDEND